MIVLSPVLLVPPVAGLYGAVIGSFVANAAVRLPENRSLWVPSSCPRCGERVRWYNNIPVVSWFVLRGRCPDCGQPISPLYPLVEALCAVLALLVARHLFQTSADLKLVNVAAWVYEFGFVSLLVLGATVDARHRILPDETTIYAVPFGIAGHAALGAMGFDGWWTVSWTHAVYGAVAFGGMFLVVGVVTDLVSNLDSFGLGDVKLAAMIGSFLGLQYGLYALLVSSIIATLVGLGFMAVLWRRTWLPYGPSAAIAAIGVALYGDVPFLAALLEALR